VRVERLTLQGDPAALAASLRAPGSEDVAPTVAEIVADVRARGDAAVADWSERLDGVEGRTLRVAPDELEAALAALDPNVRAGLEVAISGVAEVAAAGGVLDETVTLPQGQTVRIRELPVRRAGIYVPGGRAPYPSSVVMGAVTARAAGVEEVAVCSPPEIDPVVLGACALCAVTEVYRVGGAQAIAALAYGTESIPRVDVVAGPGNAYVTEAKRQVFGAVGIDGLAGPSELVVLLDSGDPRDARLVALDLLAQAEHGEASLVVCASPSAEALDAVEAQLAGERPSVAATRAGLVQVADARAALALAEALAPEHLQLVGEPVERLAGRVRCAGCVLVGAESGTAFSDYVAGSNHVLPTGGAARFASGLSTRHFTRRVAEVAVGEAAAALARLGAPVARAEGFPVHAESMEARIGENGLQ
jgi:histidinol dehydrogenase